VKINYQLEMERELARIGESARRPRLLLHACCAPCSSYVLEALNHWFDIDLYYYNPNIAPRSEFDRRAEELQRLAAQLPHENDLRVIVGDYDNAAFMAMCRGHEDDPEGGPRCALCFRMRLQAAARLAAQLGSDYYTTTLTISPMKDAQLLNAIGLELAEHADVRWLCSDFKKKNGYKRSCELSEQYGLYRQDYCGCVFSRREREARLAARERQGIVIPTERLTLVPLSMKYLHSTHDYASDAVSDRFMMFLPNEKLEETERFIRDAEAELLKPEPSYREFAILLDGEQIGGASMFLLDEPHGAELGWILNRSYRGQGYATEAARGLMAYARAHWGIRRFIAQCDGENAASERVMKRLGMRLIDRSRGRKNRSSDEEREELTYEIAFDF